MPRFLDKLSRKAVGQQSHEPAEPRKGVIVADSPGEAVHHAKQQPVAAVVDTSHEQTEDEVTGLFELWPGRTDSVARFETRFDIVAIHGLNGDAYKTWTDGERFWLQDYLPSAFPDARIFTYGYNSKLAFSSSASNVEHYAWTLLHRLHARRRDFSAETKRPIIFICHSLGGIVLKKALVIAHERSATYGPISRDTFGVMFMGTPHRGSDIAFWSKILGSIGNLFTMGAIRTRLLEDLKPKSECLGNICSQFVERAQALHIFTIYERLPIKGVPGLIVDEHSAVLQIPNEVPLPIEADHRSMCRFSTDKSEKYQMVFDCLKELVDDALGVKKSHSPKAQSDFVEKLKEFDPESILRKIPKPLQGTCTWIMKTKSFRQWRETTERKVLWLWGMPGVGKTVMMRQLLENTRRSLLRQADPEDLKSIVAYFFFDDKTPLQKTEGQLVRSILYQILVEHIELCRYLNEREMTEYHERWRANLKSDDEESLGMLWKFFTTVLQRNKDTRYWIFIDALDETDQLSRQAILRRFGTIVADDFGEKIKLLICDRSKQPPKVLSHAAVVELGAANAASDVRRYISSQVDDLRDEGKIPWKFQTQIEETLLELSNDNFLQAGLAWTNFHSGVSYWTPPVIERQLQGLKQISKQASAYYCSLLQRIPDDLQDMAKMGFTWVLGARNPLTVPELEHAVAISSGQSSWADLVNALGWNFELQFEQAFGYLLRISDNQVAFTHQTVKELLTEPPEQGTATYGILSKFQVSKAEIDAQLAKSCIVVLSFRDFMRFQDIVQNALSDSIKEVVLQAMSSGGGGGKKKPKVIIPEGFDDAATDFQQLNTKLKELKRTLSSRNLHTSNYPVLSYCVSYWSYHCGRGNTHPEVVESLARFVMLPQSHLFFSIAIILGLARLHHGALWNGVNQFSRVPPLHFIMRLGDYPAVVKRLLLDGHNINEIDSQSWTPVCWAILENRKAALATLLRQDAISINRSSFMAESPLHLACQGDTDIELFEMLINDPSIDVNGKSSRGLTPLHWCLSRPNKQSFAELLLAHRDLDVHAVDNVETTYLDRIFFQQLSESFALALIKRADFPQDWFKQMPGRNQNMLDPESSSMSFLRLAGSLQWYGVEDLILSKDPTQALEVERDGMNLLERYAYHGLQHRLFQVLTQLPPEIFLEASPKTIRLPLLCAQQDWEFLVQTLRDKFKLDCVEADKNGRTVLHWAAEFHWASIISIISGKSPQFLNHQTSDGKTALHLAAEHRNAVASRGLLAAGGDYHLRDTEGKKPAHVAAEQGHRNVLRLLLQQPESKFGKDNQGRTLLHFLAMWQPESFILQYIDQHKPQIDSFDDKRRTPLHYAAIFGNQFATRALLARGASPSLQDATGKSPLHNALLEGSPAVVKLLLNADANLSQLDMFGRNYLQLALQSRGVDLMIELLQFAQSKRDSLPEDKKSGIVDPVVAIAHRDRFGQTTMHRVCRLESPEMSFDSGTDQSEDIQEYTMPFDPVITTAPENPLQTGVGRRISALRNLGADVNISDYQGSTPLHIACKSNNKLAVEALLEFSETEPSIEDHDTCTPMDYAAANGHTGIVEILHRFGAWHSSDWRKKLKPMYNPWQDQDDAIYDEGEWTLAWPSDVRSKA